MRQDTPLPQIMYDLLCRVACYFIIALGMVYVCFKWLDHSHAESSHIAEEYRIAQAEYASK